MHLDGFVGGLERGIGGEPLAQRGLARVALAHVLHPAGAQVQQAAHLVVAHHARDLLLDQLVLADLAAKALAAVGIAHAGLQRGTDQADRA
jgi:hypothetical protein